MTSVMRAGEKRPSDGPNDGDSAVPLKVEALGPASSSPSNVGSRNSFPYEPSSKTDDVTSLYTAAELKKQVEQNAKQYQAKMLELESSHATEKAQLLAKAVQDSRRHGEETDRLTAEIELLKTKLHAMQEADAAAASVKKEAFDEEAIRQEMEQRFTEERLKMEQRFAEVKLKIEQENTSMKKLLTSNSEAITALTNQVDQLTNKAMKAESEKTDIERTFAEAKQKAEPEIASMKHQLKSKSEEITALANKVRELTAKATKAESEKMEARQHSWEYYAQLEALQKEVHALRAASHAFSAPPAPNDAAALPSSNQIYVGKITSGITEEILGQYFSRSGRFTLVAIVRHPSPGVPGYAFVHFSTPAEAHHALAWNAHSINGQDIVVGPRARIIAVQLRI
ncbi:hypothetical protein AAVH_15693 [Aphelenchoides avenae]|nr:hypothetical protein AAVH_15693 [Aphelenchus avenae]